MPNVVRQLGDSTEIPSILAPIQRYHFGVLDNRDAAILTALQEQLGLRLESTKGQVEVIVIDHAERPSSN